MDGIADYQFQRSLGRGNNGEFFVSAPPPRLGVAAPTVTVKVVDGPTPEDAFRRATRELRAFAMVQCPQLVTLYDAGQDGDRFYYSMEHLPLGSLASPSRPLTREEIIAAVADAARAAHALHEAGIAHRDIEPSTILLTDTGGKLADLGIAQVLNPGQTVTGLGSIGSVEFMDPSILRGDPASRSADVWGLGVTLHRALTGVGVYGDLPEREPLVAIRKVLSSSPVLSDHLMPAERAIIDRCTQLDPNHRYPTAAELAGALDAAAAAS
jgi:eukaryotic-like serine/threonine-protein kinase